jgi:hypothetical protein
LVYFAGRCRGRLILRQARDEGFHAVDATRNHLYAELVEARTTGMQTIFERDGHRPEAMRLSRPPSRPVVYRHVAEFVDQHRRPA